MATSLMLAALLLTSDRVSESDVSAAHLRVYAPLVKIVAISLEVMDPREANYLLVPAGQDKALIDDLLLLKRRYKDLKTAPFVCEAHWLPPKDVLINCLNFARQEQEFIQANIAVFGDRKFWQGNALVTQSKKRERVYDKARDVRSEYYYVTIRRQALRDLRTLIGDEAYCAHTLPSPSILLDELQ